MQDNFLVNSYKDDGFLSHLTEEYRELNRINPELYVSSGVKRGLRNADGTGVMAGLTQIGSVQTPLPGLFVQTSAQGLPL